MILGAQKRVEAPQNDDSETLRDESTEVLQGSQNSSTCVLEPFSGSTREQVFAVGAELAQRTDWERGLFGAEDVE